MFLELAHTKLDVFITGKNFVLSCYKLSKLLPQDERFNMVQQLRRAALSVQLNIAEGSSRYFKKEEVTETGALMIKTFQMLSKMIVY
jgi:23S rRNA-intervening sequence protein